MNYKKTIIHAAGCIMLSGLMLLSGCAVYSPDYRNQKTFTKPCEAVNALVAALETNDVVCLKSVFGDDAEAILSSGDPVTDRHQREVFLVAIEQDWTLEKIDKQTQELIIGHEQWPFPVPLVKDSYGWWFNTLAGLQEILARRIGRNELAAIGVLQTYVIAQREYAGEGRDGKPAGIYAQKISSDPGKRNGLYWPLGSSNEKASPFGKFVAQAAVEGYLDQPKPENSSRSYHGYFYRILTSQGSEAPGGARNYILNGEMSDGFAMIAYPATYENSGIMTFLVSQDGIIYESDLGEDTLNLAGKIRDYNPDENWKQVIFE